MQQQKLYIKGMVCERCIVSVKRALEELGIDVVEVALGEVLINNPARIDQSIIEKKLSAIGFSILTDRKLKLVKAIKAVVAKVYSGDFDFPLRFRFSCFIADELRLSYDSISATFSSIESTTIEKYILDFRIEKIKEAIVYTDQKLADIAFSLGFSSAAHLSRQFKLHTGLTPSYFKEIKIKKNGVRLGITAS